VSRANLQSFWRHHAAIEEDAILSRRIMRLLFRFFFVSFLGCLALAQQPSTTADENKQAATGDSVLKELFESKIRTEWDALKNKDKKAYGDLLADEYQGVEVDGQGERNKLQAMNEVPNGNIYNYTLWGLKVTPLSPDSAFVIYEVTMQFPPRAEIRYSRVYIGSLWVKRDGQWKELHYQETHVK
jgi:hypothetical protein